MQGAEAHECPVGHYCPEGTVEPYGCPVGTFSNQVRLTNDTECTQCTQGKFIIAALCGTFSCKCIGWCNGLKIKLFENSIAECYF